MVAAVAKNPIARDRDVSRLIAVSTSTGFHHGLTLSASPSRYGASTMPHQLLEAFG
jgi:hypothetical protein